jgi:hypothetical protein
MNTETLVDTSATTQIPADEQLSTLQTEEHDDADPAKKEGDAAALTDHDKTIRKLQRRIDSRTRGLGERDAEIAHLRRQLEQRESQRSDETPQGDGAKPLSEADVETRARQLADDRVYRDSISNRTQSMLKAAKEIDGFSDLAADVASEIPFLDRSGKPTPFIEDILDREPATAAKLIEHIARDPELLADLAEMTERQRTRRLALLETEIAKKPATRSKAPTPLSPLNGNARSDGPSDNDSVDDWVKKERARIEAKKKAR